MRGRSKLSARSEQILCSICQSYIETGQPVASADISRLRRHHLSAASIRSVMSELASEGYLAQPHASAGRIPTGKAFQLFVDLLPESRVHRAEFGRIRDSLNEAVSVEQRMNTCAHLLEEMTNSVAIGAVIPAGSQVLEQVQLVSLGDRRVLMVVVTSDKMVHDRVVALDEPITQEELSSVCNYINRNFSRRSISDVQRELRERLAAASAAYDLVLKRLILLYEKGLLSIGSEPEVCLEGAANLVAFELRLTKERLKSLYKTLEEKKLILQLLERFLEQPEGRIGVRIGLESEHPDMGELVLIGITVPGPGGVSNKLAVLGPLRMDYQRAMSAVLHVGRAMGSLPS